MILLVAAAAVVTPTAVTDEWIPVGVTDSRLRVFIERSSVRTTGLRAVARVRIGAPRLIANRVAIVYQTDEIDCASHEWRMTAFEAFDDIGRLVQRRTGLDGLMLPAIPGTIGGEILATVCTR